MREKSTRNAEGAELPYQFGDLLALARLSWVREMAHGLSQRGHADYRRSDAAVVRLLAPGAIALGRLGDRLGVTRQAARKLVDGLAARGYVAVERDPLDARRLQIRLTPAGESYAHAVVATLEQLNLRLAGRVDHDQLAAADAVLRAAITDAASQRAAQRVAAPGARPQSAATNGHPPAQRPGRR
ncbi:MAG: MarR family winged helix-turn-helix transcriptional regulator [Solirubrobacteraceae bacterium]